MFKRKGTITSILLAVILFLAMPMTTLGASDDVDEWSTKTITDNKKVWTISFSHPLKESTIKKTTVYVKDEDRRSVTTDVTLSKDKKSIIVTPRDAYKEDKTYKLNISKSVTSDKGKKLESDIVLPFTLDEADESEEPTAEEPKTEKPAVEEAITKVSISPTSFATIVTVVSTDSVNEVKANNKDMHYEGNNTYSLGLTALSSGDEITIKAYGTNGKRIFEKDYEVE